MDLFSLCIPTKDRYDSFLSRYLPQYLQNPYIREIVIACENGNDFMKIQTQYPHHPKLKCIRNPTVLGPMLNKLNVARQATSEWIALIDSDNFADVDYFESAYKYIQQHNHTLPRHCILAPSLLRTTSFDFRSLIGKVIRRQDFKGNFTGRVFHNVGNYILRKDIYEGLETPPEYRQTDPTNPALLNPYDVIQFTTILYETYPELEIHVLDMQYTHVVHNGSVYLQEHTRHVQRYSDILRRLERL